MKKRLFALFLALVMVIGLMPASAIAADGYSGTIVVQTMDLTYKESDNLYGVVPYMDLELAVYNTDIPPRTALFTCRLETGEDGTLTINTNEIKGLSQYLVNGNIIEINPIDATSAYVYRDNDLNDSVTKVRHIAISSEKDPATGNYKDPHYNPDCLPVNITYTNDPINHAAKLTGDNFSYTLVLFLKKADALGDLTVKYAPGVGATGTAPIDASVAYGGSVTLPSADGLTKTGYSFAGWKLGETTYAAGDTIYNYYNLVEYTEMDGTLTLTAQWTANTYNAIFNANGGAWDNDDTSKTVTTVFATAITAPADPTRTGYTFDGWSPEVGDMTAEGMAFTAQWKANSYNVTLDPNGGSVDSTEVTVTYDAAYGELPAPSKEGYTFDGWYDGETKIESTTTVTKTGDHTLTAKWTANPYTISFDSKGGSAVDSITLAYGAAITAPADPTRTGYTFDGWSPSIPDTMPVNGLTVTAQWKANSYTVSFDSNGGSAVDSKTVTYDAAYGTLPVPTREGYTFEGWIHNGGKVEADTVVKTAGNHSLTASWSHVCKDDNEDGRCDICDICLHGKPEGDAYCSVSGCQHYLECMCHPDPTRGERTVDIKTVLANGSPAANVSVQLYVNPNNGNAHYPIGSVYTTDANGLVTITDDVLDDLPYGVTIYCGIAGSGWDWESAHPVRTVYGPYLVNAGPVKDSNGNGYVWLVAPAGVGFTANFTCIVKQTGTVTPPEDTTPEEPNQPEDPTPTTYTVTYTDGVANAELFADQSHTVESGAATPAFNGTPSREGYTFEGWSPAVANTVTGNVTYTAQWKEIETPTPEDPVPATYTVKFYANGGVWADGSVVNTQTVAENGKLTVPADPVRAGYEFIGWTPAVSETVTADVNYFAVWVEIPEEDEDDDYDDIELPDYAPVYVAVRGLNTADHVAYIVGYGDGTVNPTGTITRAEVATIFFRLMTDDARDKYWSNSNPFSDVSEANWFNTAVSTLYAAGAIVDCDDEFRPNDPITRAELAVMAAQFARVYNGSVPAASFTDVSKNHWAAEEIAIVQFAGWIEGYKGEYRPEDTLTRAECMTIVNRMLQRGAESENMLPGMVTFSDNLPSAWYYEAVLEAANSHTYTRSGRLEGESFRGEIWVKLLDAPDWAAMEKAWAEANKD